jgi:uncharacterized protein YbaR (Trm112 family)
MLDKNLLDILACPICKGKLVYNKTSGELICKLDRLAFPIRDEIPVMLESAAREIAADEEILNN